MRIASVFALVLLMAVGLFVDGKHVERADAATSCRAGAQSISQMKNIGCRHAKRVYWKVRRRAKAPLPECRGERAIRIAGWRITAKPIGPGGIGIATRFARGKKAFLASGGGTC